MTVVQEDQGVKLLGGTQLQKRKPGNWVVASGSVLGWGAAWMFERIRTGGKKNEITEKLQAGDYCWDTHQTSHAFQRNNGAISATAQRANYERRRRRRPRRRFSQS